MCVSQNKHNETKDKYLSKSVTVAHKIQVNVVAVGAAVAPPTAPSHCTPCPAPIICKPLQHNSRIHTNLQ